ncbi:MAG: MerR family transcriptional regulator [Actinomycetales bacterium]|nr:MerR family transcriptional regulator [Actinomycetales bacterium]
MSGSTSSARVEEDGERWPPGISRTPTMNIGGALSILQREFPTVSVSKVRFLEEQGLVAPHRTPSGYRTYSQADVERLRFALAAQRDSFLPLRIIRERLGELDAGARGIPAPGARVVSEDGELTAATTRSRLTAGQTAEAADCDVEQVRALTAAGLISTDSGGKYPSSAVAIVRLAAQLAEHGIDGRHLRSLRSAADRQLDLIEQIVAPVRSHRTGPASAASRAKAHTLASDLTETFSQLHTALVRAGIDRLL